MSLRLHHIVIDCQDALAVATFWSTALARPLDDGGSIEFASIGRGAPDGPGWLFARVPEPKTAKNRMHPDLASDDRAADVDRLVALGASVITEHDEGNFRWTVLADPEENEFCIVQI